MKRSIITFIVFLAVQCGLSQRTGYWNLPSKSINGLNYFLFEETGEVMVADENCWEGELVLPTVVNWDGNITIDNYETFMYFFLVSSSDMECKS